MNPIQEFKAKCQGEFDELLPQAYALIEAETDKPCDEKIILRYADLGKRFGATYSHIIREGGAYRFCLNVTLSSQSIDHPDQTQAIIAHELAHFVIDRLKQHHGNTQNRGKWGVHGAEWKKAARSLGDSGDRCHQLTLIPAAFKMRALMNRDGNVHHVWQKTRKDAGRWFANPNVISVEVKDVDGFWVQVETSGAS
jgi:hypothetical protein